MSVANVLFDVLAPVAVLVALGAAVGPWLDVDIPSLSRLSYWVFGPAFVFAVLAEADLERSVVVRLVLAGVAGMVAAAIAASIWAVRQGFEVGAATVMTSVYGNVGNAGLAIVGFALGEDALPIAGVLMLTINLLGLVVSVGLARARTASPLAALGGAVTAPMAVAGLVALVVNVADAGLPVVVDRSIGLLAQALIPVMLVTLGLQLVKSGRPRWSGDLSVVMLSKLAVAPAGAALAAAALGLEGDFFDAVVIQSAMPPAVFCSVVALENDLVPDRVTRAVVATTLGSIVTLPIVLIVL
jgi:predicted permease